MTTEPAVHAEQPIKTTKRKRHDVDAEEGEHQHENSTHASEPPAASRRSTRTRAKTPGPSSSQAAVSNPSEEPTAMEVVMEPSLPAQADQPTKSHKRKRHDVDADADKAATTGNRGTGGIVGPVRRGD